MSASTHAGISPLTCGFAGAPGRTQPATYCLEGSCYLRLSYGRPGTTLCMPKVTCRPRAARYMSRRPGPAIPAATWPPQPNTFN